MEKISSILKTKQPKEYEKLNKNRAKSHLHFEFIDRLMREQRDRIRTFNLLFCICVICVISYILFFIQMALCHLLFTIINQGRLL